MKTNTIFFILSSNNNETLSSSIQELGIDSKTAFIFSNEDELFKKMNSLESINNIVIIKDINNVNFSLKNSLKQISTKSAMVLKYSENQGQELILLNKDYSLRSKKTLPLDDFHDGYEDVGVYILSEVNSKELNHNSFEDLSSFIQKNGTGIPTVEFSKSPCAEQTPALFLDRDGIINVDINYLHMAEDFELYEGIIEVIRYANQNNWPVFVVTNQSGVGRQRFTDKHVTDLHEHIESVFNSHDVHVADWIHCSFHAEKAKDPKYKKHSLLRKPDAGMLLEVAKGNSVDISKSFMIGDKVSDEILLPGLKNLHIKRQYDLTEAKAPVFEKYEDLLDYIKQNS